MQGQSDAELLQQGAELLKLWGFQQEYGFHVVEWAHDEWCPCDPRNLDLGVGGGCQCEPDATIVLHIGLPEERRITVVRNGIPLPIPKRAKAKS